MTKLHKKQLGSIGEMLVAANLMAHGYSVFTELGDLSRTDLIAIIDNVPIRIQVKTRRIRNDVVEMELKKSGPNYKYKYMSTDVDVFALYVPGYGIGYFSSEFCNTNKASLTVRINPPKVRAHKKCRFLKHFRDIRQAIK